MAMCRKIVSARNIIREKPGDGYRPDHPKLNSKMPKRKEIA
jgi:hypothetical protein